MTTEEVVMFGSVIGLHPENIRKTRLVFAEYAQDTILLVDNDFDNPDASERDKRVFIQKLVEQKLPGTTFEEYQEKTLEQSMEVVESFDQIVSSSVLPVVSNGALEAIEFCREKVAGIRSLIRRLNLLFVDTGLDKTLDEEGVVKELQKFYIHASSEDEMWLAGNIWIFNQIFDTTIGLDQWQKELDTIKDSDNSELQLPKLTLEAMAILRQFYLYLYQNKGDADCVLLGEYAEIILGAYWANRACSQCSVGVSEEENPKLNNYTNKLITAILELMTTPMMMLPKVSWTKPFDGKIYEQAIHLAIESEEEAYDESVAEASKRREQRIEGYDALLSIVNDCDQTALSSGDSSREGGQESTQNDRMKNVSKVNPIESIRLFSKESQVKKSFQAKKKELLSVEHKLDKDKKTLEQNVDILKNYYTLLQEKATFINEGNERAIELEKRSNVLTATTIAASTAYYVNEHNKKKEAENNNSSNSNSVDPMSIATGIGAAASGIALGITEKDLNNLKVDIESAQRKVNRFNYVVGHPEENDDLIVEIKELSQKRMTLKQEINDLSKEGTYIAKQTKNGKILVGVICALLVIGLIAAISIFSPPSSSQSNSKSTTSSSQTTASTSGSSSSKSTSTNQGQSSNVKNEAVTGTTGTSTSANSNNVASYILPDSNSRYYSSNELNSMTDKELYLARNEIFARHGREFKNQDLRDYFGAQSWYVPQYSGEKFDSMDLLNDYEKKNADLMLSIEQKRGSSYLN